MFAKAMLTGKALILASGPYSPGADQIVRAALQDYTYQELELQRIDLGGRTILAMLIALDPVHVIYIEEELIAKGSETGLDIAMELL